MGAIPGLGAGHGFMSVVGPNVLTGGTASASSTFSGSASNVVDGDSGTNWVSNGSGAGDWWQYDLGSSGAAKVFRRVTMLAIDVGSGDPPTTFRVEASNDGSSFPDLATGLTYVNDGSVQTFDFVNTTAYRYLRITCETGSASMCLSEITAHEFS